MRLQRALETYFEPAAEEGEAGSQQPAPQAPLRQSPHLPDHLREALAGLDDGGLGDLLGFYSGSRYVTVHARLLLARLGGTFKLCSVCRVALLLFHAAGGLALHSDMLRQSCKCCVWVWLTLLLHCCL